MTQAIDSPILVDEARTQRDRQIHHLVDLRAAAEAAASLDAAAARKRDDSGVVATALASAASILQNSDDAAARDRLREVMTSREFLALVPGWTRELREAASKQPDNGACTLASALKLWSWTVRHVPAAALDELSFTLASLLAGRSYALDVTAAASSELRRDLSQVYAARVAAQTGATCAELVFGYRKHLTWDAEGCATCYDADELDSLEAFMPGIASGARTSSDVLEADGSHPTKRGPCTRFDGVERFLRLRERLDGCLTGARIAKDRAATAFAASEGGPR